MIRMLSRLPIALANAGVALTELYLDCFPLYAGFAQLLLHEKQTASELEWELQPVFSTSGSFLLTSRPWTWPHLATHHCPSRTCRLCEPICKQRWRPCS